MDHYQIIRNKMSYIFSIFECSENGHFLNTLLFLLKLSKPFTFNVHKPVIYSIDVNSRIFSNDSLPNQSELNTILALFLSKILVTC